MRCLNCGEEVKGNYKYCYNCGCKNKWTLKRKILYFVIMFLVIYFAYAIGVTLLFSFFAFIFGHNPNPFAILLSLLNPLNSTPEYLIIHTIAILIICTIIYLCTKASNSFVARKAKKRNIQIANYNANNNIQRNIINNQTYMSGQHTKEIGYTIIFIIAIFIVLGFIMTSVEQKGKDKDFEKTALDRVNHYAIKLNDYLRDYHQKHGYDKNPRDYCDLNPENNPIMLDIQCDIEYDWVGVKLSHCLVNNYKNKSFGFDGIKAYVESKKQFASEKNECLK